MVHVEERELLWSVKENRHFIFLFSRIIFQLLDFMILLLSNLTFVSDPNLVPRPHTAKKFHLLLDVRIWVRD